MRAFTPRHIGRGCCHAIAQTAGTIMTAPSGLKIIDIKVGTGPSPKPGQRSKRSPDGA